MDRLFEELKQEESYELEVYRCTAGHPTVGVGHNLDADPAIEILGKKLKVGDKITDEQALRLFEKDISKTIADVNKRIPFFKDLSAPRQYVLISMAFNMGVAGLLEFKNTLAALKAGDITGTVLGMKASKWFRQVKTRGAKLIKIMQSDKF
jgi:lysozyme